MDYTMEELGLMFGMTLDELNEISVNETCEYFIRTDDEDDNTVHCLISDGYEGFMLIADNREDTYAAILGSQVMVVPSGTYLEVLDSMDKFRNGEYETVH